MKLVPFDPKTQVHCTYSTSVNRMRECFSLAEHSHADPRVDFQRV